MVVCEVKFIIINVIYPYRLDVIPSSLSICIYCNSLLVCVIDILIFVNLNLVYFFVCKLLELYNKDKTTNVCASHEPNNLIWSYTLILYDFLWSHNHLNNDAYFKFDK